MILVTGPTGKVGSDLVAALRAAGASFKALVRSADKAKALEAAGIATVQADLDDGASLKATFAGVDMLFLLAAPGKAQLQQELNALAAAKASGVKRIVKLSAYGADSAAATEILAVHGLVESAIRESGLAWTFLRPHVFFQNLAPNWGAAVAAGQPIYASAADARSPWIHTQDIAAAAVKVLTESGHETRVYDLTGPESLSFDDIAARLSKLLGRTVPFVNVSDGAAYRTFLGYGMDPAYAFGLVTLYQHYRKGTTSSVSGNVELLTGHEPRGLDSYLKENLAAFRP